MKMMGEFFMEGVQPGADETRRSVRVLATTSALNERKASVELMKGVVIGLGREKQGEILGHGWKSEATRAALTRALACHPL